MKDFPFAYPRPDWLPDWRDESAYTNHGDDMEAWAWECLRRNPEYQAAFARWSALPDTEVADDGVSVPSSKYGLTARVGDLMAFYHADPPAIIGEEMLDQYVDRIGFWPDTLYVHLCQNWGMVEPRDPASPNPPDWFAHGDPAREMPPYSVPFVDCVPGCISFKPGYDHLDDRLMHAWWPKGHDRFISAWAFDLRFNINDQVDSVREILKEIQGEAKARDDMFVGEVLTIQGRPPAKGASTLQRDIRILDAKWSGASNAEIISAIFGSPAGPAWDEQYRSDQLRAKKQAITDAMRRIAVRIAGGGWRELVRWSLLPQSKENKKRKKAVDA